MMKISHFLNALFIFSFLLLVNSCKKDPIQYAFEGTVTDDITGTPLIDVEVKISQKKIANGSSSDNFMTSATETTDAEGKFATSFDREMVTAFQFSFKKTNYFPVEIIENSGDITTDGMNNIDQKLAPISWVSLRIKNEFPQESDHFKLNPQTFRENCLGCATNSAMSFYGELDTTIIFPTTANIYNKFLYYEVTSTVINTDSLFTTPFDTISYTIFY